MRFLSLFSGIGGLDLGLERAGWTCVAQVECEPFALEVLAKHWPSVPRFTDVRSVSADSVPPCDAIVGGFPCQPHSAIGKQLGSSDDRNLWPEFRRLVAELKPRVVVGENVPGLDRTMLAEVVRDLEELGYSVGVLGLAAATIGAPHLRERRFIVAMADSIGKGLEGHPRNVPVLDKQGREPENEGGSVGQSCIPSRNGYQRVRFASECDPNGDGWCSIRDIDPAECDCIGPTEDGVEYFEDADRALWGRRIAQPGLGNQPDGVSSWMVGPGPGGAWPSRPGPQAAWEEPRTDFVIDLRAAKLKALGNAVVPQVAELVGRAINELCDE